LAEISAEVKEGPADCIRMDEVRAALNNNNNNNNNDRLTAFDPGQPG